MIDNAIRAKISTKFEIDWTGTLDIFIHVAAWRT